MTNLSVQNNQTMTLKEITDLLDVEHNKAMKTVAKMSESPEFGTVEKVATVYNQKGQTIETYDLDKRQSMAVSAKLNTALLMKVIDRWQELEAMDIAPLSLEEMTLQVIRGQQEKITKLNEQAKLDAPKVEFAEILTENHNTRSIRVWVKAMKSESRSLLKEKDVFKWLRERKYLFKDKKSGNLPYAKYEPSGLNYFKLTPVKDSRGVVRSSLQITGKGMSVLTGADFK